MALIDDAHYRLCALDTELANAPIQSTWHNLQIKNTAQTVHGQPLIKIYCEFTYLLCTKKYHAPGEDDSVIQAFCDAEIALVGVWVHHFTTNKVK